MKAGTTMLRTSLSQPERARKAEKPNAQARVSSEKVNTKTHGPSLLLTLEDFGNHPNLYVRHYPDFVYVFGCYPESANILKVSSVLIELIETRGTLKTHLLQRPHIRDEMFCDAVDRLVDELLTLSESDREDAIRLRGTHFERLYRLVLRGERLLDSSPTAAELRPCASIMQFADIAEASYRNLERRGGLLGDQSIEWLTRLKSIEPAPRTRAR